MASKLGVYNDALLALGERKLASLSEAREPRRALDDAYDGAISYCLEQGFWNFAMRAVQADSSVSVVPVFGYQFAFEKPSDWVRTFQVSDNETFEPFLNAYADEPNYWYANSDPIFIKYVSDDTGYGRDLSIWPETFAVYFSHYLALRTAKRITGSDPDESLRGDVKKLLADARSKDAMNEPPGKFPGGTWVRSRMAGSNSRRDV